METRLFRYLENLEVDTFLLQKMSEMKISYSIDYLTARRSGLTIEESHKAIALTKEFSRYGLEIIISKIEARSIEDTSRVIKRWRKVVCAPPTRKIPKLF
jgi:hypothetical protein